MALRVALLAVLLLLACSAASALSSSSPSALNEPVACSSQIVVVAPSAALPSPPSPPQRRQPDEPFFSFVSPPASSPGSLAAVIDLINAMGHTYEAATGRRLFPVRAAVITSAEHQRRCGGGGSAAASRVSWEPSTGRMVVVVSGDANGADNAASAALPLISALARQVVGRVAESAAAAAAAPSSTTQAPAAAAAVATLGAAFAAAATAVALPLWQCIGCVALLGLLFPLAINAALGAAADAACVALKLDPTSCFDLSLGALFAGVVLAALSSVPIYALCRLAECGKRGAVFLARSAAV